MADNTICPYCNEPMMFYASSYPWPYESGDYGPVWGCEACDAWVGAHRATMAPKGSAAKRELRDLRIKVHDLFDPLWKAPDAPMDRHMAYQWLAYAMEIDIEDCHIGYFREEQCQRAIELLTDFDNMSESM